MIQNQKQTNNKIAQLETEITSARNRLQFLWNIKGCTDAEVLGASIELDILINKYLRLLRKGQEG